MTGACPRRDAHMPHCWPGFTRSGNSVWRECLGVTAAAAAPLRSLAFTVAGIPAPQGSKRHLGKGVLVESSKAVEPWREAIKYAARRALVDPTEPHIWQPFDGPIQLDVLFRLPRPKSAPKRRWAPAGRPDLDKCVRAVCDALTDAGVWRDDSRVVDLNARKRYAIVSPPGADITISEVVS